jgi:hypothetical protein
MKKMFVATVFSLAVLIPWTASLAQAPHEIAGFVLGENIDRYKDRLRMDTILPLRHMEYLSEVEVKDMQGFKSGDIRFGTCDEPGRIVRIKMKYIYPDKEFFEKLLDRFKKKFGEPVEYKGDPFHAYVAWKWSFRDRDNNRISMILQHYGGGDDEETPGNSVKLTMSNLVQKERECYLKAHSQGGDEDVPKKKLDEMENWERFIPK